MSVFSFLSRFKTHLYAAFALRTALILYGDHKVSAYKCSVYISVYINTRYWSNFNIIPCCIFQDSMSEVKFTDVDYRVFTDAARHIYKDGSPYDRHTYRYTPLLAWMLIPNVNVSPLFGKFLFCGFDIIAGHLIYAYVKVKYTYIWNSKNCQVLLSSGTCCMILLHHFSVNAL